MESSCTNRGTELKTQTNVITLCQCKSLYSPSCATCIPPVKICPCISFHSRDVAFNWLFKKNKQKTTSIGINVI